MADVKQKERLTYRQQQALATRAHIAATARQLFRAQGYAATSVEAIAAEAGVAVSTVYAIFRNKKSILAAICDTWLEEAQIRPLMEQALMDGDVSHRIATAARWTRQQWERGADVLTLLHAAAQVDADVAAMLAGWIEEKSRAMAHFVASLEGSLRPGLDVERASDLFDALTIPELYRELVDRSGWQPDKYEQWLARVLAWELLGQAGL
ncbi:MAG: TetR/AcrR family transcriptional regulator [Caldilineaceae bacterium]|nr:TetR/AcrR family transcriptional regulator [Caldilineaceae bacterium]